MLVAAASGFNSLLVISRTLTGMANGSSSRDKEGAVAGMGREREREGRGRATHACGGCAKSRDLKPILQLTEVRPRQP